MKLYRLKHIPTGMYFTPSKGSGNLSKKGKVYVGIRPSLEWVRTIRIKFYTNKLSEKEKTVASYFNLDVSNYIVDTNVKTSPEDWEIIEIKE